MLKLTPDQVNQRYPVSRLEFYQQGIKIVRKSMLEKVPERGKKKMITKLSKSSLSKLAFMAQNTPLELKSMLTLSYGQIYPSDGYSVKGSLNRFLTWTRRKYPNLGYIWFLEFQARGAPHIHILMDIPVDVENRKTIASYWLKAALDFSLIHRDYEAGEIASAALKMYRVHKHSKSWEAIRNVGGARGYITKYASKPAQKNVPSRFSSVGRFWGNSRNAKPKPLSTQSASEEGVRLYLRAIDHKMARAEILPKYISTFAKEKKLVESV